MIRYSRAWLMIWPERRRVSEPQIRIWYSDAVANGDADPGLNDPDEMARELDNIGYATFSHR